ncbi:MAG: phosphoribosyltransferase [Pyrinomonadaceae bacterium]
MNSRIVEVYSAAQIAERVAAVAGEISAAHREREVTILGVLEDSFMFLADLLRQIDSPLRTTFLRYDHRSLGGIQDLQFITPLEVANRDLLLVEGVLETGVPQEYLIKQLEARGAASVRLCVLMDKPDRRRVALEPDWRAFETHEEYVFGYGLGFQERWRNLPFIARPASAAEGG